MEREVKKLRKKAAEKATRYLSNELTYEEFMDEFEEIEDEKIEILVDLLMHQPKKGGFLGVNEKDWNNYQSQIDHAIGELRE